MRIKGYTKSGVLIFVPVLFSIAVLPLFNLDFTAMSQGRLAEANVNADNLYLFVVNSATFGTLATFFFALPSQKAAVINSPLTLFLFLVLCFCAYIYFRLLTVAVKRHHITCVSVRSDCNSFSRKSTSG